MQRPRRVITSICAKKESPLPKVRLRIRLPLRCSRRWVGGAVFSQPVVAALDFIRNMGSGDLAKGREKLIDNAELCAEMTRAGAKALGLELFASAPGAALTAITSPDGLDSGKIVKEFR